MCVAPQEDSFLLEKSDKVMGVVRVIVTGIKFFSKSEERFRVASKVTNVKYCSGVGYLVLLEVVIETSTWTPIIGAFKIKSHLVLHNYNKHSLMAVVECTLAVHVHVCKYYIERESV